MKHLKLILLFISLILLSACWNSTEIDDEALVHGVGIETTDRGTFNFNVEIIKPSGQSGSGESSGESLVVSIESDTLLNGARELIRYAKRRLYFGHTRVWIFSEDVAKNYDVSLIDIIRRDQMNRSNSYLFISKGKASEILNTPTLYENLTATELVSGLEQSTYVAEFAPIKIYEFFRLIEGPTKNAYVPLILTEILDSQTITKIEGTAVINNYTMVGELNNEETIGLTWLLDDVDGGVVTVPINQDQIVSVEIKKAKTTFEPKLKNGQLEVKVVVETEGTLGDNITNMSPNQGWLDELEPIVSKRIESFINSTLTKLQNELKTDITNIGIETYRTYPKQWQKIKDHWDEVFANAEITIEITTNINHPGLIEESVNEIDEKPSRNPYPFFNR